MIPKTPELQAIQYWRERCDRMTSALRLIANYNDNQRLTKEADDMAEIAQHALSIEND